jgi:hypothetical protein
LIYTFRSVTWKVNGRVLPDGVGEGSRRGITFRVGLAGSEEAGAGEHPKGNRRRAKTRRNFWVFMLTFYAFQ